MNNDGADFGDSYVPSVDEESYTLLDLEDTQGGQEVNPQMKRMVKYRVRCHFNEASLIIDDIKKDESLVLYLKNVQSIYKKGPSSINFRFTTQDCGIDHVYNKTDSSYSLSPLIEVVKSQQDASDSFAWRFDLNTYVSGDN